MKSLGTIICGSIFFGIRGTKIKIVGNKKNTQEQQYLWG
jgi:hypothetical protein